MAEAGINNMAAAKNYKLFIKKKYLKQPQAAKAVPTEGGGSSLSGNPHTSVGLWGRLGTVQPSATSARSGVVAVSASFLSSRGGEIAKASWGNLPECDRPGGGARNLM